VIHEDDPMSHINETQGPDRDRTGSIVTVVGFVLYLAAGFPFLFGGLIMPGYAVGILGLVWLAGLLLAIRWRRRRGLLALPFIVVGIWLAVAWLGDTFLDWTA
jgi:hypothetical protein